MTRRRTTVAVLAAGCLLMTGCSLRPGVAAEVGSETITTSQVDDFATSLCAFVAGGGQTATSADARTNALSTMVSSRLIEENAPAAASASVDPAQIEATVQRVDAQTKGLSADDREDFLNEVRRAVTSDAKLQKVVSDQLAAQGVPVSSESARAESVKVLQQWSHLSGVSIDPRFGSWDGSAVKPGSGSLSVPTSTTSPDAGAGRSCS